MTGVRWLLLPVSLAPAILHAQGTTATVRVELPVALAVARLHASTSTTGFGALGQADLEAGDAAREGPSLSVKANSPYTILISATASSFGPGAKPASDIAWGLSAAGPFHPLTTTDATMLTGASGGVGSQQLWFRVLLSMASDQPGEYQLGLRFTLTAP